MARYSFTEEQAGIILAMVTESQQNITHRMSRRPEMPSEAKSMLIRRQQELGKIRVELEKGK